MNLNKHNFDLLNSKYNLKMNVLTNTDTVEFELLHDQEDLEAILNSMIKETQEDPIFKGVLDVFSELYKSYENYSSELIQRVEAL